MRFSEPRPTTVTAGSRWFAHNGPDRVQAQVWSVAQDLTGEIRVFFKVAHRPDELLNCYQGAFLQRYDPEPE